MILRNFNIPDQCISISQGAVIQFLIYDFLGKGIRKMDGICFALKLLYSMKAWLWKGLSLCVFTRTKSINYE